MCPMSFSVHAVAQATPRPLYRNALSVPSQCEVFRDTVKLSEATKRKPDTQSRFLRDLDAL
jgi:hypothetical protein